MAVRFDPKKSALIIQDLQNDVIMPGGAFTKPDASPAEHAKKQNVVGNVKALAAAARAAGMPVIHVWYIVEPGAVGVKQNAPLFQAVKATKGLVRGTHGAAPVKGLEAKKGDHVVEKTRMNAFHGTNLDNLLRGLGAETVVITGAWTNFSIEHTARHAADAGYHAVVVTDGTSTINDEWQHAALDYALINIADRASTAEVLAVLKRRAGRKAPARKAPARKAAPRRRAAARR
jgi:gluconolactonase